MFNTYMWTSIYYILPNNYVVVKFQIDADYSEIGMIDRGTIL